MKPAQVRFDGGQLVGTWSYVSGLISGRKVDTESFKGSKVVIIKETITLDDGPTSQYVMKYNLDTKKKPVAISMTMTQSPVEEGSSAEGIVEVKGDELKICYAPSGGAPQRFEAKEGSDHHLFILKRSK